MTLCAAVTSILALVALKPLARMTKDYSARLAASSMHGYRFGSRRLGSVDKLITVQWEADSRFQPFLGQIIGSTVTWSFGQDSGTATVSDCRVAGFGQGGLASFEMYLTVQPS
jgi:hypothetical protein